MTPTSWPDVGIQGIPIPISCERYLVPLTAIADRKSYAAAVKGLGASAWHLAMIFVTDFLVQWNG